MLKYHFTLHRAYDKLIGMIKQIDKYLQPQWKANLMLKAFSITKVPLLFLSGARVKSLDENSCHIVIPFIKINKNHWGTLYFGALAMGADACIGLLAMDKIQKSKFKISLVFKSFEAQFHKRPNGETLFICDQGPLIDELITKTISSSERQNQSILAYAVVGNEKVADFRLELSLKKQS